ncbi:MAG: peptidoglycan-binding protein, partial [Minwuiales bacterium]|nr:peptidoglycan-binding protein [Minwuiales bacterium]
MHRKRATHRGIERSEDNQRRAGQPAWAAMLPGRAALRGSIGCLALLMVSACAVPGKLDELSKRYLPEQLQSAFSNQDKDKQVGANQPPPAAKRPAYVAPKSERQQVRSAQTMLAQLGYSPGPADGV